MRKVALSLMLVLLASSVALAVDPLGPPVARYGSTQRNWGAGIEFGNYQIESDVGTWLQDSAGLDLDFSPLIFLRGDYVSNDGWAAFLRVGRSEAEIGGADYCSLTSLLNDGDGFLFGGGGRWTFQEGSWIKWGGIAQALYFSPEIEDKSGRVGAVPATVGADLEYIQLKLAAGPTICLTNRLVGYGGIFAGWRWVGVEVDVRMPLGHQFSASDSDDGVFAGLFAGLAGALTENTFPYAEYQWEVFSGEGKGWFAGFSHLFK